MKNKFLISLLMIGSYLEGTIEKKLEKKVSRKRTLTKKTPSTQDPITLTATNLKNILRGKLTVIMVGAEWCRSCKLMSPIFKESYVATKDLASYAYLDLGKHFHDQASLLKQLKLEYNVADIELIPSFLVFKNGEFLEKVTGSQTKEQLAALVKKYEEKPTKKTVSLSQE